MSYRNSQKFDLNFSVQIFELLGDQFSYGLRGSVWMEHQNVIDFTTLYSPMNWRWTYR